jgi:hypothetical protein
VELDYVRLNISAARPVSPPLQPGKA